MIIRSTIISLALVVVFAATSSPVWLTSVNIKAGMHLISLRVSNVGDYHAIHCNHILQCELSGCFHLVKPSLCSRYPHTNRGIIDYQLNTATSYYFSYAVNLSSVSTTGYQFRLSLFNGTVVNSWRASFFCYDYSIMTFISSASSAGTYSSNDSVGSGSGYREYKTVINFSTGAINMSHAVYIMPFINSVILKRASTNDNFVYKATLEIINSTSYYRIHATDGNCLLSYACQYRITYDQTAVQSTQKTYLDAQFFTGSNGTPNSYSLIFSDPTNYHCGVNHYNFSGTIAPEFRFDPVTFTLTSTSYVFVNLSTINYRYRSCVSPTIYFMES